MSPRTLAIAFSASTLLLVSPGSADPQAFLPPAPEWRGASESLVVPKDHPWVTPSELTGLTDSPNYADTIAWLRRLCDAAPQFKLVDFGTTPQGRTLHAVIASREGAPGFAELRANGRPTLLAQAGIHSGEIDGKDAGMMLLRDIAFGGKAALLDRANLVFVPVFNADGHERSSAWNRPNQRGPLHQGWRTTAQNLNLNRDYAKADSPEMQAMIRLIRAVGPSLYLDLHVTDGVDYQYDITYGFNGWDDSFAWSPRIAGWLDRTWRPAVDYALAIAGHIPGPLVFAMNNRDLTEGIQLGPADPRYSTGYGDLRHVPTVLVENHSLKPYKQRVLGTYLLLEASLRLLGGQAEAIAAAIAADEAARPSAVPLNWPGASGERTTMTFAGIAYEEFDSPVSGRKEVRWLGTPKTYDELPVLLDKPKLEIRPPVAYWVPATKPEVIARLELHGIAFERISEPRTLDVDMYRLVDAKPSAQPFEGRHTVAATAKAERRTETFPAGSVRVPTDQPLGELVVALLEPESIDSYLAWGFFAEILQRTEYIEGYVIAPMAEKMLADSPELKAAFEAKLAEDPAFAADPGARLRWFYEKTKFYDDRHLLYPVGLER